MSERDARQFVVRVLDVAQGAGALVQVDDQPPRWLSGNDSLAVDVPVQDEQVGRAMTLLRRVWDESGEGTGVVCRQTGANHWSDVVRWVSDSPEVEEPRPSPSQDERRTPIAAGWGRERSTVWVCPRCEHQHAITGDTWLDCGCGARYRFVYGDEPEADVPARWSGWSEGEMRRIRAAMSSLAAEEGLGDLAEEFSSAVDREYARREEAKAPTYRGPGYYTDLASGTTVHVVGDVKIYGMRCLLVGASVEDPHLWSLPAHEIEGRDENGNRRYEYSEVQP